MFEYDWAEKIIKRRVLLWVKMMLHHQVERKLQRMDENTEGS